MRMLLLLPLALYAAYAGGMYATQLRLMLPGASGRHHAFSEGLPPGSRLVELPASFGKVRAIYMAPGGDGPAPAIVFAHGNLDRARDYAAAFAPLAARGIGVLSLEYPGYDGADGEPDFATLNEAATQAYDWLARQPQVDAGRIVGMGYSMGGGIIAQLSAHRPLAGLVLLSTYTSIADMANRYGLPAALVRLPYDNAARVAAFGGPVLVVHGRRDHVIPYPFGERLARSTRRSVFVSFDCGHDDCGLADRVFATRLPEWMTANGLLQPEAAARSAQQRAD